MRKMHCTLHYYMYMMCIRVHCDSGNIRILMHDIVIWIICGVM